MNFAEAIQIMLSFVFVSFIIFMILEIINYYSKKTSCYHYIFDHKCRLALFYKLSIYFKNLWQKNLQFVNLANREHITLIYILWTLLCDFGLIKDAYMYMT